MKKAVSEKVSEDRQFLGALAGGASAGLVASIVRVPTEVIKQRMQAGVSIALLILAEVSPSVCRLSLGHVSVEAISHDLAQYISRVHVLNSPPAFSLSHMIFLLLFFVPHVFYV